ncbi:MAG: phenylalanine--tRNA ligase subunit alpha [Opitutales bacterium]
MAQAAESLAGLNSLPPFEAAKAAIVGPNGSFTAVRKNIGRLPKEERPAAGKLINEAKEQIEALLAAALERIRVAELAARLGPAVDVTLTPPAASLGSRHLIMQIREELCSIMHRAGFAVAEGPEVETEFYCFDALNTPPEHPARAEQDTYYMPDGVLFGNVSRKGQERYLLRTHISTVQIREMLKQKQPPIRIVSPGRCYRRDTTDATHSASFHQIECLAVDEGIGVKDLKAILDYVFKSLLGKESRVRFRPHFFPYTEPSFEVDFYSGHLPKVGKEWVEIGGCGMVDPNVFTAVGYDPVRWSGYAFGFGLERIAMILSGVDDIRYFYQNDVRFLRQFA